MHGTRRRCRRSRTPRCGEGEDQQAKRDEHVRYYEIELDKKKATLTHQGIEAQKVAGIGSFYVGENIDVPHLLEQSIRATRCTSGTRTTSSR